VLRRCGQVDRDGPAHQDARANLNDAQRSVNPRICEQCLHASRSVTDREAATAGA
jgi:hypothetical protein